RDLQRAHHRGAHAAYSRGRHVERDRAGQERPADDRGALGDHDDQHEAQRNEHGDQGSHHQHGRELILRPPPGPRLTQVRLLSGDSHQEPLLRLALRLTTARAITLTMMVKTNSSTPRPISPARNTPVASPNSLAMTAGML